MPGIVVVVVVAGGRGEERQTDRQAGRRTGGGGGVAAIQHSDEYRRVSGCLQRTDEEVHEFTHSLCGEGSRAYSAKALTRL